LIIYEAQKKETKEKLDKLNKQDDSKWKQLKTEINK
jgi:hypothetical protein